MGPFSQSQWSSWAYPGIEDPFSPYSQLSSFPNYLADSMESYQTHHNRHLVHHHHMSRATESKPRLSKEEVEVLEAEFQKNHKPSSSTKKALAESMRVDNARINNWFQNRRAREKKENNIREYEAKQRLEKEKAEAESGHQPENSRQRDLVASSAPFPEPHANPRPGADASQSPSAHSMLDASSDTTEPSRVGDSASPPLSTPQNRPVTPDNADASALHKPDHEDEVATGELAEHMDGYFNVADVCADGLPGGLLTEDQELIMSVDAGKTHSQLFHDYHALVRPDADRLEHAFAPSSLAQLSPTDDDSQPASPQAADVASRRNRRPAPLSIAGGRVPPSFTPRLTTDLDPRGDRASPLRRVSSTTGSSRVRKAVATPRSPFLDAAVDVPSQTRRSPSVVGPISARAPPTPDTPVALHQQGLIEGALSYSLEGKYMSADLALQDPTLRTPPTTPGFMENLFNMGSGYDMSISEETLIHPGLGRLPAGYNMAGVTGGLSGYVGSEADCSAQHPSLLPSQMGHNYYGDFLGGGNTGFNWTDLSSPAVASPGLHPRQPGYMEHDSYES
ncbi:hypothetical protein CDD83_1503 [Cordyceps sp. RAO-2017]|nr:hypothetical protein CDD83_1503 [Cordyceps sp. RAO-2017]